MGEDTFITAILPAHRPAEGVHPIRQRHRGISDARPRPHPDLRFHPNPDIIMALPITSYHGSRLVSGRHTPRDRYGHSRKEGN